MTFSHVSTGGFCPNWPLSHALQVSFTKLYWRTMLRLGV
jgi:hypothetical protein